MLEEDISKDWKFYSKTVEVYLVKTSDRTFYVTTSQAEVIKRVVEDTDHKDRMVFIGDDGVRVFSILAILKVKKKLYELPIELQQRLSREQELFSKAEAEEFSDTVKKRIGYLEG